MTLTAGQTIGINYRLVEPIGRGGMGELWAAEQRSLSRRVALKFIQEQALASEAHRARFAREARLLASLSDPHIVQVFDSGVHQGSPWMAMELLEGEDLGDLLLRRGRLGEGEAKELILQAAHGLDHAHRQGLIHRDIKPRNLFLSTRGGADSPHLKILDFGIAREEKPDPGASNLTTDFVVLGSPAYLAPEQARCLSVTFQADLWSLAVVHFELVTGALPFEANNAHDLSIEIASSPHQPVSEYGINSPELQAFYDQALAKSPEDRFANAKTFAEALSALPEFASDAPIVRTTGRKDDATQTLVTPSAGSAPPESNTNRDDTKASASASHSESRVAPKASTSSRKKQKPRAKKRRIKLDVEVAISLFVATVLLALWLTKDSISSRLEPERATPGEIPDEDELRRWLDKANSKKTPQTALEEPPHPLDVWQKKSAVQAPEEQAPTGDAAQTGAPEAEKVDSKSTPEQPMTAAHRRERSPTHDRPRVPSEAEASADSAETPSRDKPIEESPPRDPVFGLPVND